MIRERKGGSRAGGGRGCPSSPLPRPQIAAVSAEKGAPPRIRCWVFVGILFLLSLAEFCVVLLIHVGHLQVLVDATWGVTLGQPHWKEYQSRLLGPWLARLVAGNAAGSFRDAFLLTMLGLTIAKNLACFGLVRRYTGDPFKGARTALLGSAIFLLVQDTYWIYLWDYLDVLFFSFFLYGILSRRGNLYFAVLFFLALLNRESALFIPLWMVLDAFVLREGRRWIIPRLRDRVRLLLGAGMLVLGQALILMVRNLLLVRETLAASDPEFAAQRPFQLKANLQGLLHLLKSVQNPSWGDLAGVFGLVYLVAIVFPLFATRRGDDLQVKVSLTALAALLMIGLVGLVFESRIYSMFIPFALFLPLYHPFAEGEPR